jgi:hypothetical protein
MTKDRARKLRKDLAEVTRGISKKELDSRTCGLSLFNSYIMVGASMSSSAAQKPAALRKGSGMQKLVSDTFLAKAQQVVLDNFNAHRKPDKVPELMMSEVNVVWFAKVLGGWKCIIASTVAKGLLWEVTYASARDEIYLDVYTKLNNIKISLGEDTAA